jgi:hypothetical protein
MEPTAGESASYLPELPDPCQLKVLQYLRADNDNRSLCSAARAHSRLHQAAVQVLTSIKSDISGQQQLNNFLYFLKTQGQHVDCIDLTGNSLLRPVVGNHIIQFPHSLRLSILKLNSLDVLGAPALAATLKQLCLKDCTLTDGDDRDCKLTEALQQLTGLEHLSIVRVKSYKNDFEAALSTPFLQQLQQLTYIEFVSVWLQSPRIYELQPLEALTRLADLRLDASSDMFHSHGYYMTASVLPSAHNLTRLMLSKGHFEPGALAGQTQLQHLCLQECLWSRLRPTAPEEAKLLSHLLQLQQLTHLDTTYTLAHGGPNPPAAAYAALTASSKLHHLDISQCRLPAGVWQHMFPVGKQHPHLQVLNISNIDNQPDARKLWLQLPVLEASAPEGSLIVSCCPDLQVLDIRGLQYSAELLPSLMGLTGLHTLLLHPAYGSTGTLHDVCQLTGLRKLSLNVQDMTQGEGLLLQLTQLQGLTQLDYYGPFDDFAGTDVNLTQVGSTKAWPPETFWLAAE